MNVLTISIMYGFVIVSCISALVNHDMMLMFTSIVMFLLCISSLVIVPSFEYININKLITKAILFTHVPLVVIPLLLYGLNTLPYRGIFYNPNSFGTILATLFALFLAIFIYRFEILLTKKKQGLLESIGWLVLLMVSFFLIVISGSRTSVLSALISVVVGVIFLVVSLIKAKKIFSTLMRLFSYSVLGAIIIGIVFKFTSFYDYLYNRIIYKFEIKSGRGDLFDHRSEVWKQALHEAGFFGRGSHYFVNETTVAAHNTFISILGENGWISVILFLLLIITFFWSTARYAISQVEDTYKYVPLLMLICFCSLSMAEIMNFKLSMIAMFFTTGSIINLSDKIEKVSK
ncbi:O-antigen ligase family protein [Paenibacillus sp. FSL H8-0282]|uniref:O-antigen ligase family protein n=1 Tax=Paenibacillus sp. FSL H8-0282 TaxID=2954741 RepID=UPI0030DB6C9E